MRWRVKFYFKRRLLPFIYIGRSRNISRQIFLYASKSYVYCIWKILLVNISVNLERANQQSIKFSPRDKFWRKLREYGKNVLHLLIEFQPAYNTVSRNELLEAFKEFKISKRLKIMVKLTLKHVRCRIKIQNNLSEQFETSQY